MAVSRTVQILLVVALGIVACCLADHEHEHGHGHHSKHLKIHAPLHIKLIHHHKIIKIPVVMRKHIHHHKHFSHEHVYIPLKHKPKVVYEDHGDDDGGSSEGEGHGKVVYVKKAVIPSIHYEVSGGESEEEKGHGYQVSEHEESAEGKGSSEHDRIDYGSYEY